MSIASEFLRVRDLVKDQKRKTRARQLLGLDVLEDRVVLSTLSSITGNFNGIAIAANDTRWFSSVAKCKARARRRSTIEVDHANGRFNSFCASRPRRVSRTGGRANRWTLLERRRRDE